MNKLKTLTLAVAAISAASSQAIEFEAGPITAQLNTSLSWGVAMRTEDPDTAHIHPANAAAVGMPVANSAAGSTYNYDDGTLNYEKNDLISNVVKGNMDLELVWGDAGAFIRGTAFYDAVIMDEDPNFKPYNDATKDAAGQGYDLLDAFVWYNTYMGDTPVSLRLGRQVVSWGESTFIQGGINSINPINASAVRKPGVEVKEVLLPVNMAYGSFGLTDNVTLEAFYQLEWEKTRIDGCGTFFSTNDFVADGCGPVILGGISDERQILEDYQNGSGAMPISTYNSTDEPSDDGQYGLALRWYSEALGDTEFGLYFMNIHSRVPMISGFAANTIDPADGSPFNDSNDFGAYPEYIIKYPEDIKLMGVSFNRTLDSGWSISGEVSMTQDRPIQHNTFELLLAGNLSQISKLFKQRYEEETGNTLDINDPAQVREAKEALAGEAFDGFDRMDVVQAQMTFLRFFDQVMGASRLTFISEIGVTHIPDLPDLADARYGRSGTTGIGGFSPIAHDATGDGVVDGFLTCDASTTGSLAQGVDGDAGSNINSTYCTNDGYVDKTSGGIRARAILDYPNAFLGVNMKPGIAVGMDFGNGPEPASQFIDERMQLGLSVNFDYLNKYSGGISYTMFEGGDYDALNDRDNVSLNLKVNF
jgi:hypothetical protein